jgi:hypothetical protein
MIFKWKVLLSSKDMNAASQNISYSSEHMASLLQQNLVAKCNYLMKLIDHDLC